MASTGRHLVVDGSNIATEGRTLPSLAQLDEAVRAVLVEDPDRQITVIVDATFAHRIDSSESKAFEDAVNAGEVITPPAGTVGRGDAFILQVAEKAKAAVLSNDSFQEFHGEHDWLFEDGRLIGGKPVAEVGWVFIPRSPVRGPASRRSIRESKGDRGTSRSNRRSSSSRSTSSKSSRGRSRSTTSGPAPKPSAANPPPGKRAKAGAGKKPKTKGSEPKKRTSDNNEKKGSSSKNKVEALNSAHDFLLFVTKFSIGDEVTAVVERFSSHGCYLRASSAQCYLPSSEMGNPPPTRARDVVALGQEVIARVESIDSDRRGINVVLVRTKKIGGNDAVQSKKSERAKPSAGDTRRNKKSKTSQVQASVADESAREAYLTRSETNVATKKTTKKASAKKRPAKKAAKATSSARATKAAAKKKRTAKKVTAKKRPAKKAAKKATKKATAKKRPAKKAAKKATKKATAKKRPAKKAAKKARR